jgi:two-component system nitrogen regulation sensor histidine kinase NtrY
MNRITDIEPSPPPTEGPENRGRVVLFWVLSSVLTLAVILFLILRLVVKVGRLRPAYMTGEFMTVLSFVNLLLILVLLFILFRDLVKLVLERRRKVLGSRLRTKLVLAFLGLSLIPSIFIFFVAIDFINDSVSQWFNTDLESVLDRTQEAVDGYLEEQADRCALFAGNVGRELEKTPRYVRQDGSLTPQSVQRIREVLEKQIDLYGLNQITAWWGTTPVVVVTREPLDPAALENVYVKDLVDDLRQGKENRKFVELDGGILVLSGTSLLPRQSSLGWNQLALVTGLSVPDKIGRPVTEVTAASTRYQRARAFREETERTYHFTFLTISLVILFAALWTGRTLAKEITVPIQQLAEATKQVSSGNLDYRVDVKAGDEVGILVQSFNTMTGQLKHSQDELEQTARELRASNRELDERGRYMSTVLNNISTGVFSLDHEDRVTTINHAARAFLGLDSSKSFNGIAVEEILAGEELEEVRVTIARGSGVNNLSMKKVLTLKTEQITRNLALTLTSLKSKEGRYSGMVVVFDDLTQVIRVQRAEAWQEVARRIAHEIKNPLTPIQLSAQRIQRKVAEGGDYAKLVEESTSTIQQEVAALKRLVSEFTRYARMPVMKRQETSIHEIIESIITAYNGIHERLEFSTDFDEDVPSLPLDREQLRRALMNLVENAIQAMHGQGSLEISTEFRHQLAQVRITIVDDGPGIPPEVRDKLFVPYFSTKKKGTGLGLAIVQRIISDHGGTIRITENTPHGTRVIIQLPVGPAAADSS